MALSYLQAIGADCSGAAEAAIASIPERSRSLVAQMLAKGWNCPATTSCGRLFDAVSSLLGLCDTASYEGQAAVRLEAVQEMGESRPYPCPVDASSDPAVLDSLTLFASAFRDRQQGIAPGIISRRFHLGLARGLAGLAQAFSRRTGLDRVALSGGVLQNRTLAQELSLRLEQLGLTPLVHLELPPNDACISLGQALYARVQAS